MPALTAVRPTPRRASARPTPPERLVVRDLRTHRTRRLDATQFGTFLRYVREDTPSETDPDRKMSREELVARINAVATKLGERPISVGIVSRLEDGANLLGGFFLRIRQILRELDLRVKVQSTRDDRLTFDL